MFFVDACGNGPGTGRGNLQEDYEINPTPCSPLPQVVRAFLSCTDVPSPCELITLGSNDEENSFNSIKKSFCELINNELKNEDFDCCSTSDQISQTMAKLIEEFKTKLCEMKSARKQFFESHNSATFMGAVNKYEIATGEISDESYLDTENYKEIQLETSILESAQMSHLVVINDVEDEIEIHVDENSTSCSNTNVYVSIANDTSDSKQDQEKCLFGLEYPRFDTSFDLDNENLCKFGNDSESIFNNKDHNFNPKSSTESPDIIVLSDSEDEKENNNIHKQSSVSSNCLYDNQYVSVRKYDTLVSSTTQPQENLEKSEDHHESSFNDDSDHSIEIDLADSNCQSDYEDIFSTMYEEECCCIERYNDNWRVNENRCHFVSGSDTCETSSVCKCSSDDESINSESAKREADLEYLKKNVRRRTWDLRSNESTCSEQKRDSHYCLTPEEDKEPIISQDIYFLLLENKTNSSIPCEDVFISENNVDVEASFEKDLSPEFNECEEQVSFNLSGSLTNTEKLNSKSLLVAPYDLLEVGKQNEKYNTDMLENEGNTVETTKGQQSCLNAEHNVKESNTTYDVVTLIEERIVQMDLKDCNEYTYTDEQILPVSTSGVSIHVGFHNTDLNNTSEGENTFAFSTESVDVVNYILLVILDSAETMVLTNIFNNNSSYEEIKTADCVDDHSNQNIVSKRSQTTSTDSGCHYDNSQVSNEYTSDPFLSNENSTLVDSEFNDADLSQRELSFYSVFDEPVITNNEKTDCLNSSMLDNSDKWSRSMESQKTTESHETANSLLETVIHTVVEICYTNDSTDFEEFLDSESQINIEVSHHLLSQSTYECLNLLLKDNKSKIECSNGFVDELSKASVDKISSFGNVPNYEIESNDVCVLETEVNNREDFEIQNLFAATDYEENECLFSMNAKENSNLDISSSETPISKDEVNGETSFEPVLKYGSPDSFETVWVESIPQLNKPSTIDSFEFDEDTDTSDKSSSDGIDGILQDPFSIEENTLSCLPTLNNHLDPECEGGNHDSANSVIDTERELYFKLAETMLTSSSSSPEPDSLECNIVLPVRPVHSYSSSQESSDINKIPDEYYSPQSNRSENTSKSCPTTPERFNIDTKVHSFIVIDNKKPSESVYLKSVRNMKPKAILVDYDLGSLNEPKDNTLLECDYDRSHKRSIDNFSDFYSFEPSSSDSTKNIKTPDCFSPLSFCESPYTSRLSEFKNAPQSSPLDGYDHCYEQDDSEEQDASNYVSEESLKEGILIHPARKEDFGVKYNDIDYVCDAASISPVPNEIPYDSQLFHSLPMNETQFLDSQSLHDETVMDDICLADTVVCSLLCSSPIVVDDRDCDLSEEGSPGDLCNCVELEHSLCENTENENLQDLSENVELICVFFEESSESDVVPNESIGITRYSDSNESTLEQCSYLSAASVDDEIFQMKCSSSDSVLSYTDSLLSGESVTDDESPVLHRPVNNCCQYSPLALKTPTSLSPIPESGSESE